MDCCSITLPGSYSASVSEPFSNQALYGPAYGAIQVFSCKKPDIFTENAQSTRWNNHEKWGNNIVARKDHTVGRHRWNCRVQSRLFGQCSSQAGMPCPCFDDPKCHKFYQSHHLWKFDGKQMSRRYLWPQLPISSRTLFDCQGCRSLPDCPGNRQCDCKNGPWLGRRHADYNRFGLPV